MVYTKYVYSVYIICFTYMVCTKMYMVYTLCALRAWCVLKYYIVYTLYALRTWCVLKCI